MLRGPVAQMLFPPGPNCPAMTPPGPDRIEEYWSWIAVALFLLVTVDMLTTIFAAARLGTSAEANPLMAWALQRGIVVLAVANVAAVVLVVAFFYALLEMLRRSPPRLRRPFALAIEVYLGLLVVAGLLVFANNLSAIVLERSLL